MPIADKEATVIKLKAEKKSICKQLSTMPNSEEHRNAYKELNRLMYQLYNAKASDTASACCLQGFTSQ